MAPRGIRRATGMRGAALPSLLTILVLLAGGVDAQSCDEAFTECEAHDLCTKCILAFDSEATCSEYAFDSFNTCDLRGVAYCCGAEATGDLDACLEDGYTIDYWQCILGQHGCSVTDMPCFLSENRSEEDAEAQDEDSGAARGAATAPTAVAAAAVALALAFAGSFVGL